MASIKKFGNIQAGRVAFFLCDMQERFRPAIFGFEDIVSVSKRLVRAVFNFLQSRAVLDCNFCLVIVNTMLSAHGWLYIVTSKQFWSKSSRFSF